MMKEIVCGMLLVLGVVISGKALCGELTRGSTVLEVANHATGNGKVFAVRVEGGSGSCTKWIYFYEDTAASSATYNQAFSIAMTALSTGKKVRIHNFESDVCTGAKFISITK